MYARYKMHNLQGRREKTSAFYIKFTAGAQCAMWNARHVCELRNFETTKVGRQRKRLEIGACGVGGRIKRVEQSACGAGSQPRQTRETERV
jgi:hypothetical protein